MKNTQLEASLNAAFKGRVKGEVQGIETLWQKVACIDIKQSDLTTLCYKTLKIAESSKSRNAMNIWQVTNQLGLLFNKLMNVQDISNIALEQIRAEVDEAFADIYANVQEWCESQESSQSSIKGQLTNQFVIYLVGPECFFDTRLIYELKEQNFAVTIFTSLQEFSDKCNVTLPSASIVATCVTRKNDSAKVVTQLQQTYDHFPATIFVTDIDDFDVKLSVARAKGKRLFQKPLDTNNLVQAINGFVNKVQANKLRVLFVDDDKSICTYHAVLADKMGLNAKALLSPRNILKELNQFNPDVIVLDFYMPDCSGIELAQIIRQDNHWAFTPIIFVSQETSDQKHFEALNFGADDYYIKPIDPKPFFASIIAKAKRTRWINRLNQDLKNTELENDNYLLTMDQHNLVSVTDLKGRIIDVNDNFCRLSGYSREELIGHDHRLIKSNFHSKLFYQSLWETLLQGETWHGQICNKSKSGQEYWVESTIVPFLDSEGKIYKFVSVRTDITKLKENEARFASSQSFANIGTWDWNILTGELYWSENIAPLFGYKPGEIETSYDNFLKSIHPDDRDKVETCIEQSITTKNQYNVEHRVLWPDGSTHWLKESGSVLLNENNEPQHMLGVVQSLDAQKLFEHELKSAKLDAENANKAKSEFLSRMSHELRTPLNAIMGFSQLLSIEEDSLTNEQVDHLGEITKASDHLLVLINEILDLAKIESGRIDLSIENVNIAEVLTDAIHLISPLAIKRNIQLSIYEQNTLVSEDQLAANEVVVLADNTRLKQILINLMSNAVKYNQDNGELNIRCSLHTQQGVYRIEVQDTGLGLTASQQEKLFEPFARLGRANSAIEGTGIGLVITKKLIELMGGSIGFKNNQKVGSTFWVDIPIEVYSTRSHIISNEVNMNNPLARYTEKHAQKVLYIEDNPANLRLVTQILSHRPNIETITAHEPMLGLELAEEHKPDLILLDINLPGINGFEVLKHIKQRQNTAKTPVIAISANAMPRDIEKGFEAGFDDYVTKPLDIKKFLEIVDKLLTHN